MNFMEIAENRQSCRSYDAGKEVEQEKLEAILRAAQLAVREEQRRTYRSADRGSGHPAGTEAFRRPFGAGFPLAGPCLGRGRLDGRPERQLLSERTHRDLSGIL